MNLSENVFVSRSDHRRIINIINDGASILDLGCGPGDLLLALRDAKGALVNGVEISIESVNACIEKGINVFHGDIIDGLSDYSNDAFDYVILSQTLHELAKPDHAIKEMLRVGKRVIVSFYNLAFYKFRFVFSFKGRFPRNFPYNWENTYASLITVKDFKMYCLQNGINVAQQIFLDGNGKEICFLPNWRAQVALIVLEKQMH